MLHEGVELFVNDVIPWRYIASFMQWARKSFVLGLGLVRDWLLRVLYVEAALECILRCVFIVSLAFSFGSRSQNITEFGVSNDGSVVSVFKMLKSFFLRIWMWLRDEKNILYNVCWLSMPSEWPSSVLDNNFLPPTVLSLHWKTYPFVPNSITADMLGRL